MDYQAKEIFIDLLPFLMRILKDTTLTIKQIIECISPTLIHISQKEV